MGSLRDVMAVRLMLDSALVGDIFVENFTKIVFVWARPQWPKVTAACSVENVYVCVRARLTLRFRTGRSQHA